MSNLNLSAFERVKLARHPARPYLFDLIELIFHDFVEIHGDRRFAEDPALICGIAHLGRESVTILGQQKGKDTKQRRLRNFGMPKPDGYRKALRVMKLAEKFGRPIISFIDTPGAYPGIDAEERGQAEAIARNLLQMAKLTVPIVVAVIGEGGSGGALAIGVGDVTLMLENSIYSVISPEGCAAILWKDASKSQLAAKYLKLTASDLYELKIIDQIVVEPNGGAHLDTNGTAMMLRNVLSEKIRQLKNIPLHELQKHRYLKLRRLGVS